MRLIRGLIRFRDNPPTIIRCRTAFRERSEFCRRCVPVEFPQGLEAVAEVFHLAGRSSVGLAVVFSDVSPEAELEFVDREIAQRLKGKGEAARTGLPLGDDAGVLQTAVRRAEASEQDILPASARIDEGDDGLAGLFVVAINLGLWFAVSCGELRSAEDFRKKSGFAPHFRQAEGELKGFQREKILKTRATGVEPATSGATVRCSNQLSYAPQHCCFIPRAHRRGRGKTRGTLRGAPIAPGAVALPASRNGAVLRNRKLESAKRALAMSPTSAKIG